MTLKDFLSAHLSIRVVVGQRRLTNFGSSMWHLEEMHLRTGLIRLCETRTGCGGVDSIDASISFLSSLQELLSAQRPLCHPRQFHHLLPSLYGFLIYGHVNVLPRSGFMNTMRPELLGGHSP